MSILVNGIPEPRIVLYKNGVLVDDFTLEGFEGGDNAPQFLDFVPDFLRHELDGGEILSELRGFRMTCKLFWKYVEGSEIQKLRRLMDRRTHDKALLFPYSTEKPFFNEEMTIDDHNIQLAYHYLLAQRDFPLNLISKKLVDYVPLEDPEFITWGNITLRFSDLNTLPFSSYIRVLTRAKTGTGSMPSVSSAGYLVDNENNTFDTDITTPVKLAVSDEDFANFINWTIGGDVVGDEQELNIRVMANMTVTANYEE